MVEYKVNVTILNIVQTFNPSDDAFWRRLTLAACYQLAQSVLKIGSALAERVGRGGGEVGGSVHGSCCSWL